MSSLFKNIGRRLYLTSIYRQQNTIFRFKYKSCRPRYFHTNNILPVKMYMEHENNYAYTLLEDRVHAKNIDTSYPSELISEEEFKVLIKEDWSQKAPQDVYNVFPKFGKYCQHHNLCISNEIFDDYIDTLTDSIHLASDSQLETLFYSLNTWPATESIRTRNFIEVWAALDDECLKHVKDWSHSQLLSFVSLFFMLNVTRVSEFSAKSLNKLASKAKQLTAGELLQTLFFVGVMRRQPHDMHNLEVHFTNIFSNFNVNDLGILSMGFFKSKSPIRNMELASKIINKVINDSKHVHEVSLAAILKIIRYSVKQNINNEVYSLLDVLQHEIPRLSTMCNVHLALLGTSTLTLHKDCLSKIADHILKHIDETRIKDLERIIFTFGTFNFVPDTKELFYPKVIEELKRPERLPEITKHGRSYNCCVTFFGLLGIYPQDLISNVLSPEFLQNTYGKQIFHYGREILTLHNTVEIFYKDAQINRLSEKTAQFLSKKYTDYVPSYKYKKQYNVSERMMLDIINVLEDCRGGEDFVVGDHILSHYQRGDIIVCNDHSGKPVPVKGAFKKETFGYIRKPPDDNNWIVLIMCGKNGLILNTSVPTGQFQTKIRELKTLGYHPTLVPWNTYSILDTVEDKENYLCNLIENALKE